MKSLSDVRGSIRYALGEIRENGSSTDWWRNRLLHRVVGGIWFKRIVRNKGIYVMEQDWDNLLVLDGCRLDSYREVATPGCESVRSRGAATPEWTTENFVGRSFPDTVYVTANPYVTILTDDEFHARYDLWDDDSVWSDEDRTVLPADVADRTREIAAEYPDKRLIVHFLQPHQPFVSSDLPGSFWNVDESPWDVMEQEAVDRATIVEAYLDNLRLVYESAKDLGTELPGKSVVTADHGNMFGEFVRPFPIRDYGHREAIYTPENVRVPWDVLPFDDRKEISADGTARGEAEITSNVESRLADLGYAE